MLHHIIRFSLRNKLIVFLFTALIIGFGLFSLGNIPIGAVPDITNNQVQVITTSTNLSTQDMERFITYPVELEMVNIPGVQEIRSVSKFGLSVVTIVFDDDMGTYLPRQLIAEKIQAATERIPQGFGTPKMGPITTGLGEIYQYILDVKPEYKDRYSTMDLRTIQDWIVKRQLSGIPGVVEVNTWGGYLKQYEIAVKTDRLKAMNITIAELVDALEKNNSVAGGGYIEKINQAYFIRGEGLAATLEDLENTVVKSVNGAPIYVRDLAKVGFGSASRFGAITGNGEGEKVLGQVMMLKGANSKEVIEAVKSRVAEISNTLPEGMYINAFLERSALIGRTTATVEENLLLGCLIVIFVVVLLLGNLRSGLVVASVIPLSLMFALSMMYTFGVDANLMSLGAIDFGIIIDGAVIIVEFIAYRFNVHRDDFTGLGVAEQRELKDKISLNGASKLMSSAVFGQLIILIVFIPILALSGVEGKMFRPMALTFSFALIGAMLLCFTYVPVMAALVLKPTSKGSKPNVSERVMTGLTNVYGPSLDWALLHKKAIIAIAVGFLVLAGFLFSRMGAEFVPTLDEGDFVIQPVLKTGTSLSQTIEITTQIETILKSQFPEVDQVVTRIGAAEVPTDPMSMEESDVIISLKPPSEWVSADSKDGLANKFKEALAVIPGMDVEFTQPIEMRFNELITGVRADIAIKVFGEDLSMLTKIGDQIHALAQTVRGAADITVEKIEGLPQLNVAYDRTKISRYGLQISTINEMLSLAYAGRTVGNVFEGERMFDLVVRLDPNQRNNLEDLQNLYIDLPDGGKVPLGEVANISYQEGAAKISRDDTHRRMVVGINVRDRDLQSVVDDIQGLIEKNIALPPGYTITYGGQFENLQSAKARLKIAVPIALILIFLMLYFAFNSIKEALIIFSAIPLSAVGGVLLLWLRDMPFSISAGVGFIALFGIAVLNGIVLIEHFKELKAHSEDDTEVLIRQGAMDRLRAVLLTASAAALGFLPMAISTNAGAEVQRPLATVVIGGLVSATLLTLIVLPVLYALLTRTNLPKFKLGKSVKLGVILLLLGTGIPASAQQQGVSLNELIQMAEEHNAALAASRAQWQAARANRGTALELPKTEIFYGYDNNNIANGLPLEVLGVRQDFEFPTVYAQRYRAEDFKAMAAKNQYDVDLRNLIHELSLLYSSFTIAQEEIRILSHLDSLYSQFANAADRRFELGETNYLEKVTSRAKQRQTRLKLEAATTRSETLTLQIAGLVQAEQAFTIAAVTPERILVELTDLSTLPDVIGLENKLLAQQYVRKTEAQRLLPDLSVEYFKGSNAQLNGALEGYNLGVKIPLFFNGQASRIRAARMEEQATAATNQDLTTRLHAQRDQLEANLRHQDQALAYYESEGNTLAAAILKAAELSFSSGEIDFFQYIQSLENSYDIRLSYLNQLEQYNQTALNINFIAL